MIDRQQRQEYYQALLNRDTNYEGIFFVGVKTTGVFCRPACPARKPKFEHCEFFRTAQAALLASYRACKRCRPLAHPFQVTDSVELLLNTIERNPEKRWRTQDFEELSTNATKARRQFKSRFGMTFVEYART
jgi:AraC family transcriptional regulator of adaptative response/methylated-DNA-[protein]-cysteine methyltransferase